MWHTSVRNLYVYAKVSSFLEYHHKISRWVVSFLFQLNYPNKGVTQEQV